MIKKPFQLLNGKKGTDYLRRRKLTISKLIIDYIK